jgi:hypothetical protein
LALAFFIRAAWAYSQALRGYEHAVGEAFNVALSIARGNGIADAYWLGQGPTAHVTPITPSIAASIYYMFGPISVTSEVFLTIWSIALVLAGYLAWYKTFQSLGLSKVQLTFAVAFLCLMPVYISQEVVDYRVWDGALTVLLAGSLLFLIVATDRNGNAGRLRSLIIAGLSSLLLFVNPNLGIGACAALIWLALRKLSKREGAQLAFMVMVLFGAIVLPWAIRNERALGVPIYLRSNAGLELSIANYPEALNVGDPAAAYLQRMRQVHPIASRSAARAMVQAGGEVPYARMLGHRTIAWIKAQPLAFAGLYGLHFSEMLFPRPWQFTIFGGGRMQALARAGICATLSIGLLLSFVRARRRRDSRWLYLALPLLSSIGSYSLFQPVPRYNYVIYAASVFLAVDGLSYAFLSVKSIRFSRIRRSTKRQADVVA